MQLCGVGRAKPLRGGGGPIARLSCGLLAVAAVVFAALMLSAPSALANAEIGPPVPELTHLAAEGKALLNAHLSPDLHIPVHIGWLTNPEPGDNSPAYTSASSVTGLFCQIAVYKPVFDGDASGNMNWEEEIITHELFHCYQQQIEGDGNTTVSSTEIVGAGGAGALGRHDAVRVRSDLRLARHVHGVLPDLADAAV